MRSDSTGARKPKQKPGSYSSDKDVTGVCKDAIPFARMHSKDASPKVALLSKDAENRKDAKDLARMLS